MQAAILQGDGRVMIQDLATPDPGPDQVLVRMHGCGVCASNVPPFEGRDWFQYPLPPGNPGHEGWGEIAACGAAVTHLQVGDRVACLSYNAYSTHDLAEAEAVLPLPATLANEPFPAEPLACAMNVFERAEIVPGEAVVIIGCGFLGCLLASLCHNAGAAPVICVSRRPSARELALAMGAGHAVHLGDTWQTIAAVRADLGTESCSRVIECTGKQEGLDIASNLVAVRGRLVIAGFHQDGPRTIDLQSWNWRGIDVINAHERDPKRYIDGMRRAIQAVESKILDPAPLLTHAFTLGECQQALHLAAERPEGFMKAYVTCC